MLDSLRRQYEAEREAALYRRLTVAAALLLAFLLGYEFRAKQARTAAASGKPMTMRLVHTLDFPGSNNNSISEPTWAEPRE